MKKQTGRIAQAELRRRACLAHWAACLQSWQDKRLRSQLTRTRPYSRKSNFGESVLSCGTEKHGREKKKKPFYEVSYTHVHALQHF